MSSSSGGGGLMPGRSGTQLLRITSLVGLLALGTTSARAQRGTLRGTVVDSAGDPVAGAEVTIPSLGRITRADDAGRLTMGGLPIGTLQLSVRQFGYHPQQVTVTITGAQYDSVQIKLVDQIVSLDEVDVTASGLHPFFQEFEQRRARGIGTFITRDQIDARNTSATSDLFRNLPTVRLVRTNSGLGIRFPTTFSNLRRPGADACTPMIWLDGQRAPGMEIDEVLPSDIQAIEMYRGVATTPAQFATGGSAPCGAIVIWTRRKGK